MSEISGTFFENMKISFQKFLVILNFFVMDETAQKIKEYFNNNYFEPISLNTIKMHIKKFRMILSNFVMEEMKNILFDDAVELDETLLFKKKYNQNGRPRILKIWLFGIISKHQEEFVIYTTNRRTKEDLLPLILKHVAQNTEIHTDCFSVYVNNRTAPKTSNLSPYGYTHFWVNHKIEFVSEIIRNVHTNKVERLWGCIKNLAVLLKPKILIEGIIAKLYMNRKLNKEEQIKKILTLLR